MIILQCYKCGQCDYLELNKQEVKEKQVLCDACKKPKVEVKTFEMPKPYLGWKAQ